MTASDILITDTLPVNTLKPGSLPAEKQELYINIRNPKCETYTGFGDLESAAYSPPAATSFLAVSIPYKLSLLDIIALSYSYLSYVALIVLFFWYLIGRTTLPLVAFVLSVTLSSVCESLLKYYFKQPRPVASGVKSYGMPSSHAAVSMGLWMWLGLELFIHPSLLSMQKAELFVCISTLCLPVPWARYQLKDHSHMQVFAGVALGGVCGALTFVMRCHLLPNVVSVF
eukprot:Platyproteum_vivax@DN2769_c0_g1_i1.p1